MTQTLFMLLKDCFMRPVRAVGGPGEEFEGRLNTQRCLQRCLMIVPSYAANGLSFLEVFFNLWVMGLQKRSGLGISPFLLSKEVYRQVKKELLKQHSAIEGERKYWSLL